MQIKVPGFTAWFAMTLILASSGLARAGTTWPPATVPAQINVTTDSSAGWLPSQQQISELQKTAEAFVTARDNGHSADAYALLADVNRENQPFPEFAEGVAKFNSKAGRAIELRFVKTTWTKDPAQAPVAGVYAALDFVGRYKNIDRYCGFLVMYQAPSGGSFRVMREEYNFLDNSTAASIARQSSLEGVEDAWAKASANCPGYQGEKVATQFGTGSSEQAMTCDTGPVTKVYGATHWLLYSCADRKTVVLLAEPGNPASPFIFYLSPVNGAYKLSGEGNGDKAASDLAGRELEALGSAEINKLLSETRAVASSPPGSK